MTPALKNDKGVTLIELMVGLLIFAIIAATVSAVTVPMLKVFIRTNELAEGNALLDSIANQVIGDWSMATEKISELNSQDCLLENKLPITINTPGDATYSVNENGLLCKNINGVEREVFDAAFYKNKSIKMTTRLADDTGIAYMLNIEIRSKKSGALILSREYAVKPLALDG